MWFPHIAIDFVFVLDMVILYLLAMKFSWYAIVCNSSSDVAIKIWSSAYSIVFSIFMLFRCNEGITSKRVVQKQDFSLRTALSRLRMKYNFGRYSRNIYSGTLMKRNKRGNVHIHVTLRHIGATIVAVEKQCLLYILSGCL